MADRINRDGPFAKTLRRAGRIGLTVAFVIAAGALVAGGRSILADRANALPAPDPVAATPVQVAILDMQDSHRIIRQFAGQLEARRKTSLAFERAGTLEAIEIREGQPAGAGSVIARLDTRAILAERDQIMARRDVLAAQVEQARRTDERQQSLRDRGHVSAQVTDDTSLRLAQLRAGLAEVDAALRGIDVTLDKSALVAPFDGVVGARLLDPGSVVAPGTSVVTLLEEARPRFRAGLDADVAARLSPGDQVKVRFGDEVTNGTIAQIAPDLDPLTRNRIVFVDVPDTSRPAGETGALILETSEGVSGAWVPVSALRQGPRGSWTILTVTDDTVRTEAVEVIDLESTQAYVRGSFQDGAMFIPGGTHRLVPGQPVTITEQISWAR